MGYRYLVVERRQGTDERSCGVPLDQDHSRLFRLNYRAQALKGPGCDPGQALSLLDNVEIEVGRNIKQSEHLVEHLAVLTAHHYDRAKFVVSPQGLKDRSNFDCFGPRAKKNSNFRGTAVAPPQPGRLRPRSYIGPHPVRLLPSAPPGRHAI